MDENSKNLGLIARDEDGQPLVWHKHKKVAVPYNNNSITPSLTAEVSFKGQVHKTVFNILVEKYF